MLPLVQASQAIASCSSTASEATARDHAGGTCLRGHTIEVVDGAHSTWDAELPRFRDAHFDQADFLGGSLWRFDRLSKLVVKHNGQVKAGAQVFLFTLPQPVGGGLAYVKFGPLWRQSFERDDLETYRVACEALIAEYAERRRMCLTIVPGPDPVHSASQVALLHELGFQRQRSVTAARRYMVDLSLTSQEQRSSLASKWRYNLKKSETGDLEISFHQDRFAREEFMRIHAAMCARKNYSEATWVNEFETLASKIPAALQPTVALASHQGQAVAGAVVGNVGDTAVYLFGGTNKKGLELRAGYKLQWEIVCRLSENKKLKWYDLDNDASGNPGLRQFKSGLVGKRGVVFELPGEFDFCIDWRSRLSSRTIQTVRDGRNLMRRSLQSFCRKVTK